MFIKLFGGVENEMEKLDSFNEAGEMQFGMLNAFLMISRNAHGYLIYNYPVKLLSFNGFNSSTYIVVQ
ncbi:CLUMA_CG010822, isoform A [Clunio marinus]|uniref:CLUMA_CG010822, isoform A n=1 Tax=Clunio marinus TaxID=568069 RepID=A0A1J1IG60_9DIPT|nr:CLUMA_CG010822, isoform A [Clunio marinus]